MSERTINVNLDGGTWITWTFTNLGTSTVPANFKMLMEAGIINKLEDIFQQRTRLIIQNYRDIRVPSSFRCPWMVRFRQN
jgi:hypothetical protein